ncbi:DUF2065 domain-containing protein [Roseomonas frigidaquae]|uniref:DUF2065 domain-containing protein n=1 Tax=Falsiroseomonas frigidaquae TaxID=487318 RepID=A0ABX1F7S0_9PROT|nr:DUF2065 domain-containing protein [Falsiroseomonas frigidaquae]NKE48353.1 DUF2065 domain-containing protein [Falsiroseomonas frigidaquae]
MDFGHVLAGVAVVLALEGLCYAAFPGAMKATLARLASLPEQRLRQGGLVAAAIGVAAAWIIVGL